MIKKNRAFVVAAVLFTGAASFFARPYAAEKTFRVEASKSNFTVKVGAAGLLSGFGHNHTIKVASFHGEAKVNPDALEQSSLTINVEAASLRVVDTDISDADRKEVQSTMLEKVLETGKFSTITFKSTKVVGIQKNGNDAKLTLEGDLNLHGVQRHISIPMTVSINGTELHARGEFGLKQTEYKIEPVTAGLGAVKVKDEVRLSFDIVGVQ